MERWIVSIAPLLRLTNRIPIVPMISIILIFIRELGLVAFVDGGFVIESS